MTKVRNLRDSLFEEIDRCKELLKYYESIGPAGKFGSAIIKADIESTEEAIREGDIVKMLVAYNSLKETR